MDERIARCLKVAASQHGLIGLEGAQRSRVSRRQVQRQVKSGRWCRVLPGVYRVVGAPQTWHQALQAASLWAERDFAISHRAAAALWGFARFKRGPVEVSVCRKQRAPEGVACHFVEPLHARDVTERHGFTVTTAARTLLDISATTNEQDLRASIDEALRLKWTTLEQLEAILERRAGHRGADLLRKLVDDFAGGSGPTESELEARVLDVLDDAGLPRPEKQRAVYAGRRLRRLDFHFPGSRVVIEADGYEHHASLAAFENDRARQNSLAVRGFLVLHWTWIALKQRPEQLIQELVRVLGR